MCEYDRAGVPVHREGPRRLNVGKNNGESRTAHRICLLHCRTLTQSLRQVNWRERTFHLENL
jgi:ribosomal protein L32